MSAIPALFISHGSPDLILRDIPARNFMRGLSASLPRPACVLVVSAHWETEPPTVDISPAPETIHDFFGFPDALYEFQYGAAGAPDLAARAKSLIEKAGLGPVDTAERGLDHGAWVPLILPYPQADIPICQLSMRATRDPNRHFEVGRALAPLREDGVLVMGSGNLSHNLQELRTLGFDANATTPAWAIEFRDWWVDAVEANRIDDLLDYRARAPHAARNHPEDEHLMPFYVALGAANPDVAGRVIHSSYDYGVLTMDSFAYD